MSLRAFSEVNVRDPENTKANRFRHLAVIVRQTDKYTEYLSLNLTMCPGLNFGNLRKCLVNFEFTTIKYREKIKGIIL